MILNETERKDLATDHELPTLTISAIESALLEKMRGGVGLPEPAHAETMLANTRDEYKLMWYSSDQLLRYGDARALAASEQALGKAIALEWTAIMREGGLVTWGDAGTLGDRVVEQLRALKTL